MSLSLGILHSNQPGVNNTVLDLDELWSGIRSSDKKALSDLFNISYSWLFKYGYRIIPKQSLVKDAIQELFLVLWNKRSTISQARSVKSYLVSSLKRILLRRVDKQRNRSERNYDYIQTIFDTIESVEETTINDEGEGSRKQQLKVAIGVLTKRQQEAIQLKFYRGLSNEEIAQVMSINKQSVYNHVSQAITKMQHFLGQ
jgi:RNA polymerase sigma-70 factor (ECF subfamily)